MTPGQNDQEAISKSNPFRRLRANEGNTMASLDFAVPESIVTRCGGFANAPVTRDVTLEVRRRIYIGRKLLILLVSAEGLEPSTP